ncbi:Crp/Fnr family transcriptional regulator [Flectobacillus sp. DC10W]|uniref:Crp/Fnr family transcriptional regulator n=1 Tax=Flectobacillus longus TaxID=2984207 RepID=A0ABT6YJY4_9BACT|nr:Crp/Fnr family transcriptional regulator [Flectobacillus longus]MDI9863902.1 Crp/Fnr family transcriptional regulator [Flectobacillus longus]
MFQHPLISHITEQVHLTDTEIACILSYFQLQEFQKKEHLIQEGNICKNLFFVSKGCLRLYFMNEKGQEQTIQFAIETWWMTDLMAFEKSGESGFSIQALEKVEVMVITHESLEKLLCEVPKLERYFRKVYQRAYSASLLRVKFLYTMSKDVFYEHFASHYPEFVQRIPQKVLASFLGFSPEYLSELRKKKTIEKK